jgi:large repetitive protein
VNDRILGNSIFGNAKSGIDLGADGVTPNDPMNPDTGPNNRQNFPVLKSAVNTSAAVTTITGTLQSAKTVAFRVEFFASPTADPSGFGQGKSFLGFTIVTTSANGEASFTFNTRAPVPVGQFISATATDAAGDTSEFAKNVKVVPGPNSAVPGVAAAFDMAALVDDSLWHHRTLRRRS